MKKHIPNIITLLNLLCGTLAVLAIMENNIALVAFLVVLGIIFDFFDGFSARILKVSSKMGLELDSLADMVTSGVVPGLVMFEMLKMSSYVQQSSCTCVQYIPYVGLLITLASGYRLAKFNIDTRQTNGFIGLPTPANALFILSLPLITQYQPIEFISSILQNTWFLIFLSLLSSYLLNAEIPLFALKFKDFSFKKNKVRYLFLLISLVLILLLKIIAIPLIIILYIIISLSVKSSYQNQNV